jgi:hypothetical protein
VFRSAVQRELFMSCGLDIAADRVELRGSCLVDREGTDRYLGFYVFRVELMRSAGPDEVSHALAWNRDLQMIPVSELYTPKYRSKLNRLLRRREVWLSRNVFVEASPEDEHVRAGG